MSAEELFLMFIYVIYINFFNVLKIQFKIYKIPCTVESPISSLNKSLSDSLEFSLFILTKIK